jgi:O-antigen/teichoic acid export membrane protein
MMFKNLIWNLMGEGLPMATALISIPVLISHAGVERFGALTLIWALLGYLMVFDLGLARALIQVVAERRGRDDTEGMGTLIGTALTLLALLGCVVGGVVAIASAPLATYLAGANPDLAHEIRWCLLVLSAFVPVALVSAGLRGVLEAHQEFRRVNQIKIAVGTANYLSPLFVLVFANGLVPVVIAIVLGRTIGALAFVRLCLTRVPEFSRSGGPRPPLRPLFAMGAWSMLNNLLGPLMTYADRFALAGLVPMGTLAFYTTPFEIMSRLLFIPAALSGVLFPVSAGLFRRDPMILPRILGGVGFLTEGVFLLVQMAVVLLGYTALHLWLGPAFAENGAPILTILALGAFFNATAYVPYSLIHGIGRMDITARLQLAEIPVYALLLVAAVGKWGLIGAAIAWSARTGIDLLALLTLLARLAPETRTTAIRIGGVAVVATFGVFGGGISIGGLLLALGGCVVCAWMLHRNRFMC